jgi:glutaredoxin
VTYDEPMRFSAVSALVLLLALPAVAEAEDDAVKMYGASWCGPCRAVKAFLTAAKVPFSYVDIDDERGREAYERDRPSQRGIPLLVVGQEKIVGANLPKIEQALEHSGLLKSPAPKQESAGKESYGGHRPEWWQSQFRELRATLERLKAKADHLEEVAADHHEKEVLAKMRTDIELVEGSLGALESDASNVSLPRKYRE